MSNRNLFKPSGISSRTPATTTINLAGGTAYTQSDKQALASMACTATFNGTFYASANQVLEMVRTTAVKVMKDDPDFVAKVAVYAHTTGYMKDTPLFLCGVLAAGGHAKQFRQAFRQCVTNGKQMQKFCMMADSGQFGKKLNLASGAVNHAIQEWFNSASVFKVFNAKIGNDFPVKKMLRYVRPIPNSDQKAALFAYLSERSLNPETQAYEQMRSHSGKRGQDMYVAYSHPYGNLPAFVRDFEAFKKDQTLPLPKVDFRLLDSLGLTKGQYAELAKNMPWQATQMNLNNLHRHGAFESQEVVEIVANRLRDPEQLIQAKVFPYKVMMAWMATASTVGLPPAIRDALQQAIDNSCVNVPEVDTQMHILVDVSQSMRCPVTGQQDNDKAFQGSGRSGLTRNTLVQCHDVAAMFAAAYLRRNRLANVVVFSDRVHESEGINARDAIITNSRKLASIHGGGTNCSAPLRYLNAQEATGDLVVYLSDYESWLDSTARQASNPPTQQMVEWEKYRSRNPNAKMVCMDLAPRGNAQVVERHNILQVGGFNDNVFKVIGSFLEGGTDKNHWVTTIEAVKLEAEEVQPIEAAADVDLEEVEV